MNNKIDNEIKNLLNTLENNPASFAETLKNNFVSKLKQEEKEEYNNFEQILTNLKKEIEQKISSPLLAEKIKMVTASGQDKLLNGAEELLRKDIVIFMERQVLIVNVLRKIISKEIRLSKIENNFDKYTLANFYRSYCELSPRIMSNIIYEIITYLLNNKNIDKKSGNDLTKIKNNFKNNKLCLSDIRKTFAYFEKNNNLGLVDLIDKVFLYKDGEGFSLRNKIAHDKELFSEINTAILIDEILKINRFIQAFLFVFYLNELSSLFKKEDLNLSKQLFNLK